jgi:DNA-binding NarL/FixJ family response regulator
VIAFLRALQIQEEQDPSLNSSQLRERKTGACMQTQMKQQTAEQRWNAIQTCIQQGNSNRQIARESGMSLGAADWCDDRLGHHFR